MPYSKHKKIIGHETRGKTALNRLRRVDNFLMLYDEEIIRLPSSPKYLYTFIDVGYGAYPYTTLESAWRFRQISPSLYVIGIEIDMERVRFAKEYTDTITDFRHGGFNIPLRKREDGREEKAKCIRAFNVLRQYDEKNVESSYALMAAHLIEGGLIIEGTSDPLGRMWVAHILRKRENRLEREALVFSTNYKAPFHPKTFQTILPKSLIHRVIPGENIYNFFLIGNEHMNKVFICEYGEINTYSLTQQKYSKMEDIILIHASDFFHEDIL